MSGTCSATYDASQANVDFYFNTQGLGISFLDQRSL